MSHVVPLFGEAWDHRRRRRRRLARLALVSVGIALALYVLLPTGRPAGAGSAPRPAAVEVAPSRVLSRTPYMGVSCPVANSIACDRVGLAVWLKQPALSVTATIAGRPLALDLHGDLPLRSRRPRRAFDGFLQPAGIVSRLHVRPVQGAVVAVRHGRWRAVDRRDMWYGDVHDEPSPRVTLSIHLPGGHKLLTRLRVVLSPGWG